MFLLCPCRLVRVVRLGAVVVVLPLFLFPFFLGVVWFGGVHSYAVGSALPQERSLARVTRTTLATRCPPLAPRPKK